MNDWLCLHETYYLGNWDLGYECARENCVELAGFLSRYDEGPNRLWLVVYDPDDNGEQTIRGPIAIDGKPHAGDGARLSWCILESELHGRGYGREPMGRAISFCKIEEFDGVLLWIFDGLESAQYLYREYGFTLSKEKVSDDWAREIICQKCGEESYLQK